MLAILIHFAESLECLSSQFHPDNSTTGSLRPSISTLEMIFRIGFSSSQRRGSVRNYIRFSVIVRENKEPVESLVVAFGPSFVRVELFHGVSFLWLSNVLLVIRVYHYMHLACPI